jgi:hypothetical protein
VRSNAYDFQSNVERIVTLSSVALLCGVTAFVQSTMSSSHASAADKICEEVLSRRNSAKDQALMTKLQGESGKQFDDAYIKAMVTDHRMDLREFRKEARTGGDQSLKDFASSGAQVVQEHLGLAEQLAKTHHVAVAGSMHKSSAMSNSSETQP